MSTFIATHAVAITIIWLASIFLGIVHSFFNDGSYKVKDLFFAVVFGPLNTMLRYADWEVVIFRWPERKNAKS